MIRSGSVAEPPRAAGSAGRLTEEDLLSAMPARSATREVRVGIFVLLGIAMFLTALFTLTDVGTFRGRYYVQTVIPDAGGMRRGDPVQMRGVNIGRVTSFRMVPDGVNVRMELYNEYRVPADSRVLVRSAGLLGGMVVEILPGVSEERARESQPLPGQVDAGLMAAAGELGTRADTVLDRVSALLSQRTIGAVGGSAVELQVLLADLAAIAAQQRQDLAALTGSLGRSAAGLERATGGPELERTVQQLDAMSARLDRTSETLERASTSFATVAERVERGEGTLGQLSANDSLYQNLNQAVGSLNELIEDIRANPRRYFSVSVF
jgi:phospholipid/cholesterol/gamma-HCH transport system substrate-binding protein